jgi:hypothetical protein
MNISKIIRKVILEIDEKKAPRGLDPKDQYDMLRGVIQNCNSSEIQNFKGRPIRFINSDKFDLFPEIKGMGVDKAYYVTAKFGNAAYMVFGLQDSNLEKPALLAYKILEDQTPERVPDGLGSECEQLMKIEDLGQQNLSPKNLEQFKSYQTSVPAAGAQLEAPENIELYDQVPYSKLQWPSGNPVFNPIPKGNGYAWVLKGLKQNLANLPKAVTTMLANQGFTTDQPEDIMSDSAKYAFYLKDIQGDWPALQSQKDALRGNDIIYPTEEILSPDRATCRTAIKKLDYCAKSPVGKDCGVDLFKNKFIALRCGDLRMAGGVIGIKDEYENILKKGKPYGLADLKRVVGKAQYGSVQKESIEKKINFILNEQRKKFKF